MPLWHLRRVFPPAGQRRLPGSTNGGPTTTAASRRRRRKTPLGLRARLLPGRPARRSLGFDSASSPACSWRSASTATSRVSSGAPCDVSGRSSSASVTTPCRLLSSPAGATLLFHRARRGVAGVLCAAVVLAVCDAALADLAGGLPGVLATSSVLEGAGGLVGATVGGALHRFVGTAGATVVLGALIVPGSLQLRGPLDAQRAAGGRLTARLVGRSLSGLFAPRADRAACTSRPRPGRTDSRTDVSRPRRQRADTAFPSPSRRSPRTRRAPRAHSSSFPILRPKRNPKTNSPAAPSSSVLG